MFIDTGSMVTIKDNYARKELRGRFGKVSRIRIVSHTGDVMVFVNVFNPNTGGDDLMLFDPVDLMRRRNIAIDSKRPIATDELHAIRFAQITNTNNV